jgi:hypothetical protein
VVREIYRAGAVEVNLPKLIWRQGQLPVCQQSRTTSENRVAGIGFGIRMGISARGGPFEILDDYLSLSGAFLCNSSMKFSRKMTWPEFCWVAPPA